MRYRIGDFGVILYHEMGSERGSRHEFWMDRRQILKRVFFCFEDKQEEKTRQLIQVDITELLNSIEYN